MTLQIVSTECLRAMDSDRHQSVLHSNAETIVIDVHFIPSLLHRSLASRKDETSQNSWDYWVRAKCLN